MFRGIRRRPLLEEFLKRRSERGPVLRRLKEQVFKATTEVLDPDMFYARLLEDLKNAEYEVVVFSPYTSPSRVEWFVSRNVLKDAVGRGVSIKVVVKPPAEIKKAGDAKKHEGNIKKLVEAGLDVYVRPRIHCKAVVIDREVTYVGSLNVLSHFMLQEDYMIRFVSEVLADEVLNSIGEPKEDEAYHP